jgi:uncharacterized membrane protein YgdD (TMEM256/DUF423 family)
MRVNGFFITVAGLCGAAGVALAAAAAHLGTARSGTAAQLLIMHATAFFAIALADTRPLVRKGGLVLLLGLLLFAGDLVLRDTTGSRLFPFAAPTGGSLMIVGWLVIAVAGLAGRWAKPPAWTENDDGRP